MNTNSINPYSNNEFVQLAAQSRKKFLLSQNESAEQSRPDLIKPSEHFSPKPHNERKALSEYKWSMNKRENNNNNQFRLSPHRNIVIVEAPPAVSPEAIEQAQLYRAGKCEEFFTTEQTFLKALEDFGVDRQNAGGVMEKSTITRLIEYYRNSPEDQNILNEYRENIDKALKNSPFNLVKDVPVEQHEQILRTYFLGQNPDNVNVADFFDSLAVLSAFQPKLQDYINKAPRKAFRPNDAGTDNKRFANSCIITPVQRAPRYALFMEDFNRRGLTGLPQAEADDFRASLRSVADYSRNVNDTAGEIAAGQVSNDINKSLDKIVSSNWSLFSGRRNFTVIKKLVHSLHIGADNLREIPSRISQTLSRSEMKKLMKRMDRELNRMGDFDDLRGADAVIYTKWQSIRNELENTLYPNLASVKRVSLNNQLDDEDLYTFTDLLTPNLSLGQKKQLRQQLDKELKRLNKIDERNEQETAILNNLTIIRARLHNIIRNRV